MKNVYLVVTDLHCAVEKANRLNYFGEVVTAMQDILNIAFKYKQDGCNVNLIFLGDVFDGSVSNSGDAMQMMEMFHYFCSVFDHVWSVVGNHEISYAKNNPFWFLVSNLEDEALASIKRYIQPRGLTGRIAVPDKLVDGDTVMYFNHYGIPAKVPTEGLVKIGLFHQNVGSNDICKMWGTFDDVEEASYIQPYNYCFFGHMHLARGEYWLNAEHTCRGIWLGTIGRTKVDEVLDDRLDVNVPAIIVDNGCFRDVEDNFIKLCSRQEAIDEIKLNAAQKSRELALQRKEVGELNYKGETLYDTLLGSFRGTELEYIFLLLDKSWDAVERDYQGTLSNMSIVERSDNDATE